MFYAAAMRLSVPSIARWLASCFALLNRCVAICMAPSILDARQNDQKRLDLEFLGC
jgi:hypothetical protein